MNLLSIDLEMNQPSGTIIQVGYVVGNVETGEILLEKRHYIHTKELLTEFITGLTGIKQHHVAEENSMSLMDSYKEIVEDMKKYECFRNPLTWGGGDSIELKQQLLLEGHLKPEDDYVFGRRWLDCKTVYLSYAISNGLSMRGGLARTLLRFGLRFNGRKHDATDDAKNTFVLYRKLLEEMKK